MIRHVARRIEGFDHLFKRQILMRVSGQTGGLDLGQQGTDTRVIGQPDAQSQRVDKKADQGFQLGAGAVGDGRTDNHIGLVAQPCHQHRPARQQYHK
ncbi:hypothetical protein AADEFJLK_04583 [Methylovulum psychrotolerans]|uniref:Uncharacterized protein n=1 Tax=Methylovulum psychrotolerans TaxID=1704499 RepID=A0A2S5CFR1_9GAMM|nr:hypothetical protein AADEFJLK_04583 [Methylovulum psychrotolerans]